MYWKIRALLALAIITGQPVIVWADSTEPVAAASQSARATSPQKKWLNAIEFNCRQEAPRPGAKAENYTEFQLRINTRLVALGAEGWELVGVTNSPLQGRDCLTFGLRKPASE